MVFNVFKLKRITNILSNKICLNNLKKLLFKVPIKNFCDKKQELEDEKDHEKIMYLL